MQAACQGWLHHYNHHRPHTPIGRVPPITRLISPSGQPSSQTAVLATGCNHTVTVFRNRAHVVA